MKLRNLPLACVSFACAAWMCGCNSFDSSKQSLQLRPSDIVATVFEPNYEVRSAPVMATAEQKHFLFFSWGDADLYDDQFAGADDFDRPEVRRLKKAASSKACNMANCDLLVATIYQFERTGFLFRTIKCTVKGFPTDVVSVRSMSSPNVTREIRRVQDLEPESYPERVIAAPAREFEAPARRVEVPAGRSEPSFREVEAPAGEVAPPVRRSPPPAPVRRGDASLREIAPPAREVQPPVREMEAPVRKSGASLWEIDAPAGESEIPAREIYGGPQNKPPQSSPLKADSANSVSVF